MADNTINIGNFLQEYVEVGRVTNEKLDALANLLGGIIEGNENIKSSLVNAEKREDQRTTGLDKDKDKSQGFSLESLMKSFFQDSVEKGMKASFKSAEYIKNTGAAYEASGVINQEGSKFQTGLRAKATVATGKAQAGFGKGLGGLAKILKTVTKFLGPIAGIFLNLGAVIDVAVGSIGFLAAYITGNALTSFMSYYHMLSDAFVVIKDYFLSFKEGIISWWTDTKAGFNIVIDAVKAYFDEFTAALNTWWQGVIVSYDEIMLGLSVYLDEFIAGVKSWWNNIKVSYDEIMLGLSVYLDEFIAGVKSWWNGLSEGFEEIMDGVWGYIEDFKSSIQYVIDTLIGAFTTFTDSSLNPLNWFSGDKKAEEFDKKQEEKLVPTVDQSTIKGNQPTANSRVLKSEKTQEELIKIYKENNKAIEESNKETKLMNQKFELLINTLDSKDFSTQIYNNTTNNTTSTPSFGSGNSIRR